MLMEYLQQVLLYHFHVTRLSYNSSKKHFNATERKQQAMKLLPVLQAMAKVDSAAVLSEAGGLRRNHRNRKVEVVKYSYYHFFAACGADLAYVMRPAHDTLMEPLG